MIVENSCFDGKKAPYHTAAKCITMYIRNNLHKSKSVQIEVQIGSNKDCLGIEQYGNAESEERLYNFTCTCLTKSNDSLSDPNC